MKTAAARRVSLVPRSASDEDSLTAAAMSVHGLLEGKRVLPGDEVVSEGVALLVESVDPAPGSRVTPETELSLGGAPRPTARRLVYDAVLLVDASWSMGRRDRDPTRLASAVEAVAELVRHGGDLVREATLGSFTREVAPLCGFVPLAALPWTALSEVDARGKADLAAAVDWALGQLAAGADARNRATILLATDAAEAEPPALDALTRAGRLGVVVHVLHYSPYEDPPLAAAVRAGGGSYASGATPSFGRAFNAMAEDLGAPFRWVDEETPAPVPASAGAGEGQFEVVVRARPGEAPDPFAAVRRRKIEPEEE